MAAKARRWLDAGVRLVWIILPAAYTVEAWRDDGLASTATINNELSADDVVPGFVFSIRALFGE